jgi:hypothetical protein
VREDRQQFVRREQGAQVVALRERAEREVVGQALRRVDPGLGEGGILDGGRRTGRHVERRRWVVPGARRELRLGVRLVVPAVPAGEAHAPGVRELTADAAAEDPGVAEGLPRIGSLAGGDGGQVDAPDVNAAGDPVERLQIRRTEGGQHAPAVDPVPPRRIPHEQRADVAADDGVAVGIFDDAAGAVPDPAARFGPHRPLGAGQREHADRRRGVGIEGAGLRIEIEVQPAARGQPGGVLVGRRRCRREQAEDGRRHGAGPDERGNASHRCRPHGPVGAKAE